MFIRGRGNRRGFTLFEVMIGVAIIALITICIYRFVSSTLPTVRLARVARNGVRS